MGKEFTLQNEVLEINFSSPIIGKEEILERFRERGYRLTSQRRLLLELILENNYICCKEIYYKANQNKNKVGIATVYRFLNTLEEIGAIEKKNQYYVSASEESTLQQCVVEFSSGKKHTLSKENFYRAVEEGMRHLGIGEGEEINQIISIQK